MVNVNHETSQEHKTEAFFFMSLRQFDFLKLWAWDFIEALFLYASERHPDSNSTWIQASFIKTNKQIKASQLS